MTVSEQFFCCCGCLKFLLAPTLLLVASQRGNLDGLKFLNGAPVNNRVKSFKLTAIGPK